MRMRTRILFVIAASVLFSSFPVFSFTSVADYMDKMKAAEFVDLLAGETLTAYTTESEKTIDLTPKNSILRNMTKDTQDLDYAFSLISVTLVPYPEGLSKMSDWEVFIDAYNRVNRISTLKGITYMSERSDGKGEVLFTDAYFLNGPKQKSGKMEDPVISSSSKVKQQNIMYAFLKDSRFGGNVYEVGYYVYNDEIFVEITNRTALRYMGISAVKEGNLHLYLDLVLTEEGFLVSGLAVCYRQSPKVNVLFKQVDLPSAFMKRIDAIKNWFVLSLNSK